MAKKQSLFDTINSLKSDFNDYSIESTKFIQVRDDNNFAYSSNYVRFDSSSSIDKSVDYVDYAGSYLMLPHQIAIKAEQKCELTASELNDYAATVKTSVLNLVNSVLVKLGASQKQVTDNAQYANLMANFNLIHLSEDQIKGFGELISFYPDTGESQEIQAANGRYGPKDWLTNNQIYKDDIEIQGINNNKVSSNEGLRKRLQMLNLNPSAVNSIVSADTLLAMRKSHVNSSSVTEIILRVYSLIPLPLLHDIFGKLPIVRGLGVNLTINLNINHKTTLTLDDAGTAITAVDVSSSNVSNMCPYVMSELEKVVKITPKTPDAAGGDPIKISIRNFINESGTTTKESCWLYMRTIKFGPEMEKKLLDTGKVTVLFDDYATVVNNSDFSEKSNIDNINKIRLATVARPRKLVVIPQLAKSETGNVPSYASCLSSAPFNTPPYSLIQGFNVFKNGTPIYQQGSEYTYDNYLEAIQSASIDGMQTKHLGTPSNHHVINPSTWHNGLNYYVTDLTSGTKTKAEDNIPTELAVSLKNACSKKMDYMFIVTRQKEMVIDINSGTFEMIQE